jgi:hypothetical protein
MATMIEYTTKGLTVMLPPKPTRPVPDTGAARAADPYSRALKRLPRAQSPEAGGFASGRPRSHDWTGPNRTNVYVHCAACGKIFEVLKSKGLCYGSTVGGDDARSSK